MTTPALVPATSTNVVSYGYDEANQVLTVVHNGTRNIWNYQNVPKTLWDLYKNAHSIWIHNSVMGKFTAVKA